MFIELYKHAKSVFTSFSPAVVMFLGWIGIYFCLLSSVNHVNVRYQTPIAPLMAVLAAGLFSKLETKRLRFWISRLGYVAAVLLTLVSLAATGIALSKGQLVVLGIFSFLLSAVWGISFGRNIHRFNLSNLTIAAVITLLGIFPSIFIGAKCLIGQSLEEKIKEKIELVGGEDSSIAFISKPAFPARLRVISSGKIDGQLLGKNLDAFSAGEEFENYKQDILILDQQNIDQMDLTGYDIHRIPTQDYLNVQLSELMDSLKEGQFLDYLEEHRKFLTFVVRRDKSLSLSKKSKAKSDITKRK